MTSYMYEPTDAPMTPIEGFKFYGQALRGDWGSIDGRSERSAINAYVDWAMTVDPTKTTEKDILPMVEEHLGAFVTFYAYDDGSVSEPVGHWLEHVDEEYALRDVVRLERALAEQEADE